MICPRCLSNVTHQINVIDYSDSVGYEMECLECGCTWVDHEYFDDDDEELPDDDPSEWMFFDAGYCGAENERFNPNVE